jgi:hypothetical protein
VSFRLDPDRNSSTAPALRIVLELEQLPELRLLADSAEDELRLRAWLRRSDVLRRLPELLERLLDDLDDPEADEERPA